MILAAVYFSILAEVPSGQLAFDTSRYERRSNTSSVQRSSVGGVECVSFDDAIGRSEVLKQE